jgi:hypothetical protein
MSTFNVMDLPPIVHSIQIIILGCDIEAMHRARYGQVMSPDQARIVAMSWNTNPGSDREKAMVEDSYRTAIRVWKAARTLGISWNELRRVGTDDLINAGL